MSEILLINQIMERLPYRYPMLMLDRLQLVDDKKCIAYKNLTFNEEFFQGHFPGHPILPGVLQVEAMYQAAEILVQDKLDPENNRDIYIKKLKRVKFRKPNLPGDRMIIEVEVKSWEENNDVVIKASTRSNSGVTCQAEITLSVRDRVTTKESLIEYNEFDRNDEILMGPEKIMEYIPHRYPFLLVDYIRHIEDGKIMGIKNVSFNEPVFRGYTPEYSVLPGSIQCEIFAQVGCVYQLSLPENRGKIAYFMSITEAEFYAPILPGDQLICDITLPTNSSKFGRGEGTVTVDGKIVSKITITFAIVDA